MLHNMNAINSHCRNRLVMKNNAKKQKEFFEKRKMQQKLKDLGIALPVSPRGTSSGSMDLMTLFIVNQIAAKKEIKDPPKVTVLGSYKGGSKHKRNEPLVLPVIPCSPSQLSLVDSQSQYSIQGMRKRKNVIPQEFKCQQLSPVLESAFSDNSASDYLPPIADPLSPFSSTSSVSSGQGVLPLQLNLQQRSQTQVQPPPNCSSPPWDTSGLEQAKFQPFSQPRGLTANIPWSCGSSPPLCELETPTAAQVLFGCPEPDKTEVRGSGGHEVRFAFNQPEDNEPMLDFMLHQLETEQQCEEDAFKGFSNEENEREERSNIYLQDETPVRSSAPQTVPVSHCMGAELANTNINCLYSGHNSGPMNGCEYLPHYTCVGDGLSSDSNDDEEFCQPCHQTSGSLYTHQAWCEDTPNPNQGSQEKQQQETHSQPMPFTPLIKLTMNLRDGQKIIENVACPDKAHGNNGQQTGSSTAQILSPHPLALTQSSWLCKYQKTASETQDAGTQTVDIPTAETRNASTQCNSVTKAARFNVYLPPAGMLVQHPATGRQTDTAAVPNTHTASSGSSGNGGKKKKFKSHSLSGSSTINKFSDGIVILKWPITPLVDAQSITDSRDFGKKSGESREERGQQEDGSMMKDLSNEVRNEVTPATRVNGLLEEANTP
uniref:uncharacterized protein redic1 isoform X2 n=1 Tax=Monopterus albus TaxID=43700 RepID=UPI0009B318EA|nr:uncharacterized protein C12orf40 homolog isoform X2 [Monopterus albus]